MSKNVKNSEFTVENAKVMAKNYSYYGVGASGYIKIDDSIVFVHVVSNIFDLKEGVVTTIFEDGEKHRFERTNFTSLFQTKEAYESADPKHTTSRSTLELLRFVDERHLRNCEITQTEDENSNKFCYINVWVFENGEAKEVPGVIHTVSCEDGCWKLVDGSLPEKFWESRKDAYAFNEYEIIDADGEKFTEQGYMKRLSLTPEQWEIFNRMKSIIKEARDAKIKFFFDRDYCGSIKAVNMTDVVGYGYDTDSYDGGEVVMFKDVLFADTEMDVYDHTNEDEYAFALAATPRQRKEWLKTHPESVNA